MKLANSPLYNPSIILKDLAHFKQVEYYAKNYKLSKNVVTDVLMLKTISGYSGLLRAMIV